MTSGHIYVQAYYLSCITAIARAADYYKIIPLCEINLKSKDLYKKQLRHTVDHINETATCKKCIELLRKHGGKEVLKEFNPKESKQ